MFLRNYKAYKFETWYTCGQCIVYTRIRLFLLFVPLFLHFSVSPILSNFQTLKFFVTLFSGTVRPRRLKLGTHVDSRQVYRVYQNQAAAYSSLYFFIFLSLQFSNIKIFHHTFLRNVRPSRLNLVHTWTVGRCIVYIEISLLLLICSFIS